MFVSTVLPVKMSHNCVTSSQGKRTNLRKAGSDRIAHGMRVKFNPLALLLDSSLEGEFDLVQRIIYEVQIVDLFDLERTPEVIWSNSNAAL